MQLKGPPHRVMIMDAARPWTQRRVQEELAKMAQHGFGGWAYRWRTSPYGRRVDETK